MNNSLAEANAIVREWQGYSAKILYYNGSPGIGGGIQILFSSPDRDRFFIIECHSCYGKLETIFQWKTDELNIEIDIELKVIHLFDLTNKFNVITHKLIINVLVNCDSIQIVNYWSYESYKYPIKTHSGWFTGGSVESLMERYIKLKEQQLICIQA